MNGIKVSTECWDAKDTLYRLFDVPTDNLYCRREGEILCVYPSGGVLFKWATEPEENCLCNYFFTPEGEPIATEIKMYKFCNIREFYAKDGEVIAKLRIWLGLYEGCDTYEYKTPDGEYMCYQTNGCAHKNLHHKITKILRTTGEGCIPSVTQATEEMLDCLMEAQRKLPLRKVVFCKKS